MTLRTEPLAEEGQSLLAKGFYALSKGFLVILARVVTGILFRAHADELASVPMRGPLILAMNHVNIFEIPLIYARLQPRPIHGLVLAERWKNPLLRWVLDSCGSIPLTRGGANVDSLKKALDVLKAGEIILMMPEGTRSGNGRLQPGRPGIVMLAQRSGAPIQPVVTHGSEAYRANLRRLRRTDIYLRVGRPLSFQPNSDPSDAGVRRRLLDELMHAMAALLPPEYRGVYAAPPQKPV